MKFVVAAATIFLGAFLLFLVQPLLARFILPWFGGTPDTWTTCLLFFQTVLLAGYAYAHLLVTRLPPARQVLVHTMVLVLAAATLPIAPSPAWQPEPGASPVWRILALLTVHVGLPYFALSATAPLVQSWVARSPASRPYRLYALSNTGSLLALAAYPFVVEPNLRLHAQTSAWSIGFVVFAIVCALTAWSLRRAPAITIVATDAPGPSRRRTFIWLVCSACGSAMLMATTNQLSQDIAVVPMLWVLPLALYLISFIVCFSRENAYLRGLWTPIFLGLACAALYALQRGAELHFLRQLAIYCGSMFATCMVCHGELARLKPHPAHLARFYLTMSAGGALGGFLVAIAAPRCLPMLLEFELSLAICTLLLLIVYYRDRLHIPPAQRSRLSWPPIYLLLLTVLAAVALVRETMALSKRMSSGAPRMPARVLERSRNFYGTLLVTESFHDGRTLRSLSHGRILHGEQFMDKALRRQPLTYYGLDTGISFAFERHPKRLAGLPLRVGDVGMGAGTLAAYGRTGDTIRFYEINPDVVRIAREAFTYLSDTRANVEVVTGDGRLCLEREWKTSGPHAFDLLVVDGFSGDAVPVHLLTRECFALYARHLASNGVLAMHVSSRFLNLTPVVDALCGELGWQCCMIDTPGDAATCTRRAFWVLASPAKDFIEDMVARPEFRMPLPNRDPRLRWTDDYSSILYVLRTKEQPIFTPVRLPDFPRINRHRIPDMEQGSN